MKVQVEGETTDFIEVFIPHEDHDLYGAAAHQWAFNLGLRVSFSCEAQRQKPKRFFGNDVVYGLEVIFEKLPNFAGFPE